jgi:hypothetical protein
MPSEGTKSPCSELQTDAFIMIHQEKNAPISVVGSKSDAAQVWVRVVGVWSVRPQGPPLP